MECSVIRGLRGSMFTSVPISFPVKFLTGTLFTERTIISATISVLPNRSSLQIRHGQFFN
jgi:hypothetical protein